MPRLPKLQRHHWYSIILFVIGSFFSPLAVAARFGIGTDFWLNLLLTIIGYIPGQVHLFFIQGIRNNKTRDRTPEWALRYGLVDGATIRRHEQRSQWARKYNDRNLDSGYDQKPLEGSQVKPSWTSTHDPADSTSRNGNRLWRPEDESYYSAVREGSLHPSESDGRWHYLGPANFSDPLPGDAITKKKKKDRWTRTEDAYAASGQKKRKKSKNRSTAGDAAGVDSTYFRPIESAAEPDPTEEATGSAYEGHEEGNAGAGKGNGHEIAYQEIDFNRKF